MSWEKLQSIYGRDGIVLALGSGISIDSGLPDWKNLLKRLTPECISGANDDLFDQLLAHDFTLPVIASILEEHCRDRNEFIERVRSCLYRDFPFFPDGVTKSNRKELIRTIRNTNSTLRAVAALCAVRKRGALTYIANPRIHAIVSFNLDALLQAYVYARFEKRLLRTIERPSASRRSEKINVYHMHGFVRFDRKAGDLKKEAPDAVILTEQDYFNFFNDSTSLFNYTFLYLLREFSCLFIGLSMQDENIRRLLHYSKTERVRSLLNEGVGTNVREKSLRHFAILKRNELEWMNDGVEKSLLPLGTRVLWIDDYDELAERLAEIYKSTGDDWELVF